MTVNHINVLGQAKVYLVIENLGLGNFTFQS